MAASSLGLSSVLVVPIPASNSTCHSQFEIPASELNGTHHNSHSVSAE